MQFLFCPQLLKDLDFSKSVASPSKLSNNLVLRPLRSDDFSKGYLQLLAQLTQVGEVDEHTFKERFNQMKANGCYYITVVEDLNTGRVICAATLFTEFKFIHSAAIRGRIEDVVVDSEYRGQHLGVLIIETLKLLSKTLNCYKLTLDCRDEMMKWYTRLGFNAEKGRSNTLCIRFVE